MASSLSGEIEKNGNDGRLILVVEDDVPTLCLERFLLEAEGFAVREAKSGDEALHLLGEEPAALVLLDVGLPGIDGFTTCRRISNFSNVPVIMVTAEDNDDDKVYGLGMGADDYVTKPFSTTVLAARVKAVLRRYDLGPTGSSPVKQIGLSLETGFALETQVPETTAPLAENQPLTQESPAVPEKGPQRGGVPEDSHSAVQAMTPGESVAFDHMHDGSLGNSPDPTVSQETSASVESASVESASVEYASASLESATVEYEGTVRLLVESSGSVKKMIRFVDELRQHPLFRLMRLNANPSKEGMEILLRMREPVQLKGILLQLENVSAVEEVDGVSDLLNESTPGESQSGPEDHEPRK